MGALAHKVIPNVNDKYGGFGPACAYAQSDLGLSWFLNVLFPVFAELWMVFLCASGIFSTCIVSQGTKGVIYVEKKLKLFLWKMLPLITVCRPYMFCVHMDQKVYCILE